MICDNCKSSINDDAKKCSICQSWLNWRKYLDLGLVILGGILSLTTLYAVFIFPVYGLVETKHPELNVAVLTSSLGEARVMLINTGEAPAGIKKIYFDSVAFDIPMPAGKSQWGTLLKDGDVISLKLDQGSSYLPVVSDESHLGFNDLPKVNCKIIVEYVSFNSEEAEKLEKDMQCYGVSPFPYLTE